MTWKSERELERWIDKLDAMSGEATFEDLWIASLKHATNADLTAGEERLVEDPEQHLSSDGKRDLEEWRQWRASREADRS